MTTDGPGKPSVVIFCISQWVVVVVWERSNECEYFQTSHMTYLITWTKDKIGIIATQICGSIIPITFQYFSTRKSIGLFTGDSAISSACPMESPLVLSIGSLSSWTCHWTVTRKLIISRQESSDSLAESSQTMWGSVKTSKQHISALFGPLTWWRWEVRGWQHCWLRWWGGSSEQTNKN